MSAAASTRPSRRPRSVAPYLLSFPGGGWLIVFFLVPLFSVLSVSLMTGNFIHGFTLTWHWSEYTNAISQYHTQILRSFEYGAISTVAALLITYPMAYWIAFHGGRHKSTFLFLILLPFFVSFIIRVLAWEFLLSDNGIVLSTLKDLGIVSGGAHVLSTPFAVIAGLTYDGLPFMALPLYVSLEKIDRRVVLAAHDLYSSPTAAFLRVIAPLSASGLFAGFLLVFVTNVGDYVNAAILGGPGTTMIGNVIQVSYLQNFDYPMASSLSSILMGGLLIIIWLYARAFGTQSLQEYATA